MLTPLQKSHKCSLYVDTKILHIDPVAADIYFHLWRVNIQAGGRISKRVKHKLVVKQGGSSKKLSFNRLRIWQWSRCSYFGNDHNRDDESLCWTLIWLERSTDPSAQMRSLFQSVPLGQAWLICYTLCWLIVPVALLALILLLIMMDHQESDKRREISQPPSIK